MLRALRSILRRMDRIAWRIRTRWKHRDALRAKADTLAQIDKAKRAHKSRREAMRKAHDILRQELPR